MPLSKKRLNIGTKLQVMNGTALRTSGGLKKKDLTRNKRGKVVSRRMRGGDQEINTMVKEVENIVTSGSNENKRNLAKKLQDVLNNTGNKSRTPVANKVKPFNSITGQANAEKSL